MAQRPLPGHEPLGGPPLEGPVVENQQNNWDRLLALSDADLVAQVRSQSEDSRFDVPAHMIPDGMTYQWCRAEVAGQPDYKNISRWQAGGWQAVPQMRHDGYWMPPGTQGPTVTEGSILMEIPSRIYAAKDYAAKKLAHGQIDGLKDRLAYGSSPGSAPRDAHPLTKPRIRHTVVSGAEFEIEA